MAKIIIGFVILAVVLIFVMNQAGHVEMGGEHAGQEALKGGSAEKHDAAPAAPAAPAPAAPAPAK
jgi:hypothetical protein